MEKYTINTRGSEITGLSHRYKTEKGEISLLYPSIGTNFQFEIHSISGNLFKEFERFDALEEAEKRIYSLLK